MATGDTGAVSPAGKITIQDRGVVGRVFKSDNPTNTPDFVIPSGDIEGLDVPSTLGTFKDQAKINLYNGHGRYRKPGTTLTTGDRVDVFAKLSDDAGALGDGTLGRGGWGGFHRRFSGMVRNPGGKGRGARELESTMSLTLEDFVGAIMSFRYTESGFHDRQIAGEDDSILNFIMSNECSEVDLYRVGDIPQTTTIKFNATNVLNAANRLIAHSGNEMLLYSDGTSLVVEPLSGVTPVFDMDAADRGEYDWSENDDKLANYIRVDGGEGEGILSEESVTAFSAWETVTETKRLITQLNVPKSELSSVDIWTDPTRTGSPEGLTIRFQRDDGGMPLNINDESKDLTRQTLAEEFLEEDGFTTFLNLADHDIIEKDPWLIIETDGSGADEPGGAVGQDVGVNNIGEPLRVIRYPYPVSTRAADQDSIDKHRRREHHLADKSLISLPAVSDEARAVLNTRNAVERAVEFDARSERAYSLWPGAVVGVPAGVFKTARLTGDFVVTERRDKYDGTVLNTSISMRDILTF